MTEARVSKLGVAAIAAPLVTGLLCLGLDGGLPGLVGCGLVSAVLVAAARTHIETSQGQLRSPIPLKSVQGALAAGGVTAVGVAALLIVLAVVALIALCLGIESSPELLIAR